MGKDAGDLGGFMSLLFRFWARAGGWDTRAKGVVSILSVKIMAVCRNGGNFFWHCLTWSRVETQPMPI